MPIKLTEEIIKEAVPPPKGYRIIRDTVTKGFAIRVMASGEISWIAEWEAKGQSGRKTIGRTDILPIGAARKRAREILAGVRLGEDPRAERNARRAQAALPKPDTFAMVAEDFLTRGLAKKGRAPGYIGDTRRNLQNHVLPRWGRKTLAEIDRKSVIAMLDDIAENGTVRPVEGRKVRAVGGPIAANRILAAVRALFNFAIRRGLIEVNPCRLVDAPGREKARERVLSAIEMTELWHAFGSLPPPFGPYFKMLLLLGQRRGEVAGMRWDNLDLEAASWSLTSSETKNGRAHTVPLPAMAVDIIKAIPRKSIAQGALSKYVFTSTGNVPISGFSRAKTAIEARVLAARQRLDPKAAPIADWGIHDLRRTVATEMGRLGVSEFVIGKVLNHASKSITGMVYNQYEYVKEKRHALDLWAAHLERIIVPEADNVVSITANKRT